MFSVASVPFFNAKPLVWAIEQWPETFEVELSYDLPSRLPTHLESGLADAVLVSSIDALTSGERRVAEGCSISSHGRVMSVRLFSKVPFDRVQTLALDSSSLTSNALAQIVMAELYKCRPTCTREAPDGERMLDHNDACVLIGDKGLLFEGTGLFQLDLGEAWSQLTDLPFVWACWVGTDNLQPHLVHSLLTARLVGERNLAAVALSAPPGVSAQLAHSYLEVFDYTLTERHKEALAVFGQKIVEHKLADSASLPRFVAASQEPTSDLLPGFLR